MDTEYRSKNYNYKLNIIRGGFIWKKELELY